MNLLQDPWIPIRRQSGAESRIAPWRITEPDDPIIALAAPRPDFNGALLQFLIGLLQTATPPEDDDQWVDWLEQPPAPETLKERLEPFVQAFELEGDEPRFMQDFDALDADGKPISGLLIDAPGAKTNRDNADHFIKRGGANALCPACTATALFTLQTNAPSGGVGHRTSLRGGGPLTTLIRLDPTGSRMEDTLWRALWLNVLEASALQGSQAKPPRQAIASVFPWMAPTRTSESKTGQITTPEHVHALQVYWGMPRRIRLHSESGGNGPCDLCGTTSEQLTTGYSTQNYGTNYEGAWKHPLSPYLISKTHEALPQHAQPGGISYRHWLGLINNSDTTEPAKVVTAFLQGRKLPEEQFRLWAFGYDMDNMKARCWYETSFPLFLLDEAIRPRFTELAQDLISAATDTAGMLRGCIKEAWFKRPGDAKGDTSHLVDAFLQQTESAFYARLRMLKTDLERGEDGRATLQGWHPALIHAAHHLFDYWTSRGDFETANPRRIATAHKKLNNWLHGKKIKGYLRLSKQSEKTS